MAVTNGWLLYKRQHLLMKDTTKVLSLLQFQAQITNNFYFSWLELSLSRKREDEWLRRRAYDQHGLG